MSEYTIEKKDGKITIKKDNKEILGRFKSITPDPEFEGYYLGVVAGRKKYQVLFSRKGEFLHAFEKKEKNAGVSKLIDEILGSENIVESMQSVKSKTFWTDENVVRAFRTRHANRFKAESVGKSKVDCKRGEVLYNLEKNCIEKFLAKQNNVSLKNAIKCQKSSTQPSGKSTTAGSGK